MLLVILPKWLTEKWLVMFLMMWHFTNEKINKNDFTRKKQNDPDYKINTGSKSKPHSSIPPSDSEMHEREKVA